MTPHLQKEYIITEDQLQTILERRGGHYISCQGKFRDEIINKVRSNPHTPPKSEQEIREKVLDEFKWIRPMCFGRHEAICDTRCAWAVRKRCVAVLRSKQGEHP